MEGLFLTILFLLGSDVAAAISNEECLECWNQLCRSGSLLCDCIDDGRDNINVSALSSNHMLCCAEAVGYVNHTVNQDIVQQLTRDSSDNDCSKIFNEQRESNFDINNFNSIVSQQTQFVFPSIQFGCKGCITNVTFYTRSQQQTNPTIFNILLWGNYRNLTSSSGDSVFVLRQNYYVNVTDQLTFMPWNGNSGFSTTISLDNNDVCFEPGHVFGLSVPGSGAFNLEVFKEKSNAKTTTVYKRDPLSCESLGRLFYPQNSSIDGNVLIAVGVREMSSITTTSTTQTTLTNEIETTYTLPSLRPSPSTNPETVRFAAYVVVVVLVIAVVVIVLIVIFTIAFILKKKRRGGLKVTQSSVELMKVSASSRQDSQLPLYANLHLSIKSQTENGLGTDNPLYKSTDCCTASTDKENSGIMTVSDNPLYKSVHQPDSAGAADTEGIYWTPSSDAIQLYQQISSGKFTHIPRDQINQHNQLGSGHFGTVFCGHWVKENGEKWGVAVKSLNKELDTLQEKIKFLQEAAIMGQFSHPNIVKLYGVVTVGNPVMIVTELMTNGDLKKVLPTLPLEQPNQLAKQILEFCRQIASGMEYLSKKSFVHRDLAARNILVDDKMRCVIGDFGMARDLMDDIYYISRGGKIPVRWTAPEALHYKKYSIASDVWSFGIVLFEIWSIGKQPYSDHKPTEVIDYLEQGSRQHPPPGCSYALYELMIRCWHPVSSKRPTFDDIVTILATSDMGVADSVGDSNDALVLGGPLNAGKSLYPELQELYVKTTQ